MFKDYFNAESAEIRRGAQSSKTLRRRCEDADTIRRDYAAAKSIAKWAWLIRRQRKSASESPRTVTIHVVIRPKPGGLKPKPHQGPVQDASAEFNVHSFIVKVWLEEEATKNSESIWHGHITHVPSGEKRYLKNLDQIALFIQPYLEAMGIRFGLSERIKKCLSFRKAQPKYQRKNK